MTTMIKIKRNPFELDRFAGISEFHYNISLDRARIKQDRRRLQEDIQEMVDEFYSAME